MLNQQDISIESIVAHYIGSKHTEEGIRTSSKLVLVEDEMTGSLLSRYFLGSFKSGEYFHLTHETDIRLNKVFSCANRIFEDPTCLVEQSKELANHLYEESTHPKIKTGEFYVVYLTNCLIDGEVADAIGLFKSESKENFLKVKPVSDNFEITVQEGLNVNKLDKGCLIFNIEQEKGFVLDIIDNTNKSSDAQYWCDRFLNIKPRKDEYHQTRNYLDLCKTFVLEQAPKEFDVSKADQADFLNKSATYFKKNEEFTFDEFANEVIQEPGVIESFKGYKKQYESERAVEMPDEFVISAPAVKSNSKVFKNVIKLDKNFHVYVHGNRENIVKGFDEKTGLHYYQLFFKEEQ